ncbi:hypothetical protein Ocin01_05210 [Orchesella cincta]|uniref:Uncharacterized protein n=1 Tax=Orchesella cincta TaxID=48709 RepID=A0A1D2N867_ORCCI|nr:hypothetical protein Ocin01_05210 [Orchesella cincta]
MQTALLPLSIIVIQLKESSVTQLKVTTSIYYLSRDRISINQNYQILLTNIMKHLSVLLLSTLLVSIIIGHHEADSFLFGNNQVSWISGVPQIQSGQCRFGQTSMNSAAQPCMYCRCLFNFWLCRRLSNCQPSSSPPTLIVITTTTTTATPPTG